MIKPHRRIAGRQNCRAAKNPDAHLFSGNVLDLKIAGSHISDELCFVVAFQRISEQEVVRHNPVKGLAVPAHDRLHPIIIQLTHVLLDFNRRMVGLI